MNLVRQSQVDAAQDRLSCGQCSYIGNNVKDFLRHKIHFGHQNLKFWCELCQKSFPQSRLLSSHYKLQHKVILEECKTSIKKSAVKSGTNLTKQKETEAENKAEDVMVNNNKKVVILSNWQNTAGSQPMKLSNNNETENKDVVIQSSLNGSSEERDNILKANKVTENEFVSKSISFSGTDNYKIKRQVIENEAKNITVTACDNTVNKGREIENVGPHTVARYSLDNNGKVCNRNAESDVEENKLIVSLSDENIISKACELGNSEMKEQILYTAIALNSEIPSTGSDRVKVEPVVTYIVNNNGSFYLSTAAERQAEIEQASSYNNVVKDNNTTAASSEEQDFHFISNIGIVRGQSLSYGKHEFKCLHCTFKTQWRNTLCLHMKEKHADLIGNDKQLEVNIPPQKNEEKILRMSEYINMQRKKMKVKTVRGVETQDLPGDFPCNLCGKVYHRLRYLNCHMKRHVVSSDFLCSECGKTFKTKAYLAQHLRTHREKEMYQCSQCEFSSDLNILIHAHIQLHNDGCLMCDICNTAFIDKTTLQRHKRVHDKSRPFGCKFDGCTLRFKTEVMCNAHYKQHFTKGKFDCSICGYVFRQKHHLLRHEKRIHNTNLSKESVKSDISITDSNKDSSENMDESNEIGENVETNAMETNVVSNIGPAGVIQANEDEQFDLENALQSGQLIIATDEEGNPMTYEMPDMNVNVAYKALLQGGGQDLDPHTILIPQADANNVVFEDATETVGTYVES